MDFWKTISRTTVTNAEIFVLNRVPYYDRKLRDRRIANLREKESAMQEKPFHRLGRVVPRFQGTTAGGLGEKTERNCEGIAVNEIQSSLIK